MRLEGISVVLDEISPKYFPYVISWRNNEELNRYINQPYKLTPELERKWYEDIYLNDSTQGFMIMIDRKTGTPFATLGWTDYDSVKRQCICGRLMLSDSGFAPLLMEGNLLLMDYLYSFVDVMYAHVGVHNKKALKWDMKFGFEVNSGKWEYPSEAFVNGVEQCEMFRSSAKYFEAREKLIEQFNIVMPEHSAERLMTGANMPAIIDSRLTTHDSRLAIFLFLRRENQFPVRIFGQGFCYALNFGRAA